MNKEELKNMLEQTALNSDVKVNGEVVEIKSEEQKLVEKELQDWKEKDVEYKIIEQFKIPHELLKCLLQTKDYEGLIFTGEGGIGKTILTISSIKKILKPDDWEYQNGYTTPLSLYELLYNHRNKKVIILDDVEGIFQNKLSLAILKGALWNSDGERICQYSSKSDKATMPEKFVMNAKVIILCNHIPRENDSSTRAMISRTIFYKMGFSFEEKMSICKKFIKDDKEIDRVKKILIMDIFERNVTRATKDLNFRTLRKLIAFTNYNQKKAEELFKATTEEDEDKSICLRAMQLYSMVKEQMLYFVEKTGKGRATFFRIKRGIKVSSKTDMIPKKQDSKGGKK